MNALQLSQAWELETGSNEILVGVIDTGIDCQHEELSQNTNIGLSASFLTDSIIVGNPADANGHGTHVAGLIGAEGDNGLGFSGVCWDISLVSLQVLYANGMGTYTNLIRAINYAESKDIGILNISARWYNNSVGYSAVYEAISDYSGLVVCAAGNEGFDNDDLEVLDNDGANIFPANFDLGNVITVGSCTLTNNLSTFSSYGQLTVDLFAPGEEIYSCWLNNDYYYAYGTSMATPFVTGAAALLLSYNPNLSPTQIKDYIMGSVTESSSLTSKCVSGGVLNVYNALQSLISSPPITPPSVHTCYLQYSHINSNTHRVYCNGCDMDGVEYHTFTTTGCYTKCTRCNYGYYNCSSYTYTQTGSSSNHKATCTSCNRNITESHQMIVVKPTLSRCSKCGYTNAQQIMSREEQYTMN